MSSFNFEGAGERGPSLGAVAAVIVAAVLVGAVLRVFAFPRPHAELPVRQVRLRVAVRLFQGVGMRRLLLVAVDVDEGPGRGGRAERLGVSPRENRAAARLTPREVAAEVVRQVDRVATRGGLVRAKAGTSIPGGEVPGGRSVSVEVSHHLRCEYRGSGGGTRRDAGAAAKAGGGSLRGSGPGPDPGASPPFPPSRAFGGDDVVGLPPQRRPRPRRLRALRLVLAPPRRRCGHTQRLVGEVHGRFGVRRVARGEERVDDKGRRRDPRGTVDPPARVAPVVVAVALVLVRLLDLAKDPRHELRGELFRHRPVVQRLSQRGHLAVHPHAGPQLNLDAKRLEGVARGDRRAGARLAHAVPEERREDGQRRGDELGVDLRSNNLIGRQRPGIVARVSPHVRARQRFEPRHPLAQGVALDAERRIRGRRVSEVFLDPGRDFDQFIGARHQLGDARVEPRDEIPPLGLRSPRAVQAADDVVEGVLGEVAPRSLALLAALRLGRRRARGPAVPRARGGARRAVCSDASRVEVCSAIRSSVGARGGRASRGAATVSGRRARTDTRVVLRAFPLRLRHLRAA